MKKSTIVILSVVGVLVVLIVGVLGWSVSAYNGIQSSKAETEQKASDIQTQLQRRNDLIPNLVSTVKGYAAHEEEIFTAVAEARSKLNDATAMTQDQAQASAELSSALSRLLMIVESYPDLKANENFLSLQAQLEGTENRINIARQDYNAAVKEYNLKLRRFPSNLIAGMFGFEEKPSFEGAAGIETPPSVSF